MLPETPVILLIPIIDPSEEIPPGFPGLPFVVVPVTAFPPPPPAPIVTTYEGD